MSNAFAIAAVTAALHSLLFRTIRANSEFPGVTVTTKPPDKARASDTGDQVNIFLYQTTLNAAFANGPMPGRVRPGETGAPPLALNLQYLISAYGADDEDVRAHQLMGLAMLTLHDYPVFQRADLQNVLMSLADVHEQVERVKIAPLPLSLDEMSKLWTTFQTEYRLSTAYQVTVVLIESQRPVRTPLPVARRTVDDYADAQGSLEPPTPTITRIERAPDRLLPIGDLRRRTSVLPGEAVVIHGYRLDGARSLRFEHARLDSPIVIDEAAFTKLEREIEFMLPDAPDVWLPGVYALTVTIDDGAQVRTTNRLPFIVPPSIRLVGIMPDPEGYPSIALPTGGDLLLTIEITPSVLPASLVALLVGGREISPEPLIAPPARINQHTFALTGLTRGTYPLRLRVDGVDSLLIDVNPPPDPANPSQIPPLPRFFHDQQLKVT